MLSSKSSSPLWIELVLIALNEVETKRRREIISLADTVGERWQKQPAMEPNT